LEITFSTAFFPKSIHWCFMQEFTECNSVIIAYWRAASRMPSTIGSWRAKRLFFMCWIVAEPRDGSASLCEKPANRAALDAGSALCYLSDAIGPARVSGAGRYGMTHTDEHL
jgi:hypothetical protein